VISGFLDWDEQCYVICLFNIVLPSSFGSPPVSAGTGPRIPVDLIGADGPLGFLCWLICHRDPPIIGVWIIIRQRVEDERMEWKKMTDRSLLVELVGQQQLDGLDVYLISTGQCLIHWRQKIPMNSSMHIILSFRFHLLFIILIYFNLI